MSVPNGSINLQGRLPQGVTPTRASAVDAFGGRSQGGRISIGLSEVTFGGFNFAYRLDSHSIAVSDTAKRVDVKSAQLVQEEEFAGLLRERRTVFAITRFGTEGAGPEAAQTWMRRTFEVVDGGLKLSEKVEQHAGAFPTHWIPMY